LFIVSAIAIFTAFVGADALTIRLHIASVWFGATALTNWITLVFQTLFVLLTIRVATAFMGAFVRAQLRIAMFHLHKRRTRIPTFIT
jgi:hypothetical protein